MATSRQKRVLILGGGFGGIYAALRLERALARGAPLDVTLVSRENFFLFTPMLHEVAASDLDLTHIVNPIRKLLRRVAFVQGEVEAVDLEARQVVVSHGDAHHHHELAYDHLILTLGAVTNFYGLPGVEERALTMKSLGDAIHLRNRLIAQLEEADVECAADVRTRLLTFVVAGGGFAGVETVAAMNDFLQDAVRFYPNLATAALRVVLVHDGPVILPELGEPLGRYAQRKLAERGVEIRIGSRITGMSEAGVTLEDGTLVPAVTMVWTAGTAPNPLLATLPCAKERGRVIVDECLAVPEWPGVWALGDCALVPDRETGRPYPPTAQHALRQGRVVADNVLATMRGGARQPFVFRTLGLLASLGQRTGVARILSVNFSGFVAWWLWRSIYLAKLPRLEKKVRVALDWLLDVVFSKDLVQFRTERTVAVSHETGAWRS
ncbi:MAG TPA: NAD(P)/FAD-dependent oxidoreductase [Methylomirabilota bacterium]|jgi:NADH dehydrogenase|nr:NAD(P)/FAD-dependent oxidoreductase [Methylomirabilota bacterium]